MPVTKLWAVSQCGNVYTLSTDSNQWKLVRGTLHPGGHLRGVKKVAAVRECVWALGCDHLVYVYIPASDVPIRHQVATYENERWNPVDSFSGSRLLPSDRWHFSSEDGLREMPKEDFRLPTSNWEWEGDWSVDENFAGQITDKGGWQYAFDFPAKYHPSKRINSFVRRRKWIRYRRYIATDKWARIPSIHVDPVEEPVIDLAVGGQELPNQPLGYVGVWVVTITGKLMYRYGREHYCPEGKGWTEIIPEEGQEVFSISVGPTGLIWAVTWEGSALVRLGVSWEQVIGKSWVVVDPPADDAPLLQTTVGTHAVWATSRDGRVWFRKGINAYEAPVNNIAATGTGWIEMVGAMALISMGPDDQIWGVDSEERKLHMRSGISRDNPSGKVWRKIKAQHVPEVGMSGSSSEASLISASYRPRTPPRQISLDDESSRTQDSVQSADGISHKNRVQGHDLSQGHDQCQGHDQGQMEVSVDSEQLSVDAGKTVVGQAPGSEDAMERSPLSNSCVQEQSGEDDGLSADHDMTDEPYSSTCTCRDILGARSNTADDQNHSQSVKRNAVYGSVLFEPGGASSTAATSSSDSKLNPPQGETASDSSCRSLPTLHALKENGKTPLCRTSGSRRGSQTSNKSLADPRFESWSSEVSDTILDFTSDLYGSEEMRSSTNLGNINEEGTDSSVALCKDLSSLQVSFSKLPSGDGSRVRVGVDNEEGEEEGPRAEPLDMLVYQTDHGMEYEVQEDGELCWVWLSSGACEVDQSLLPDWFTDATWAGKGRFTSLAGDSVSWRSNILSQLNQRNQQEIGVFKHYEHAIEKTVWVKKGKMQWWRESKRFKWVDCNIELVREAEDQGARGYFIIYYRYRNQQMHVQLALGEICCVNRITDPTYKPTFAIYTHDRQNSTAPIKLCAATEQELEDWVAALSIACCEYRGHKGMPLPTSAWSTTMRGDVFVYEQVKYADGSQAPPNRMFWHQYGGHLLKVESCTVGVTWAIAYDHTAFVYTYGYGGGFFKGIASSTTGIHKQVDSRQIFIYENQRWNPVTGYSERRLPTDRYVWSDSTGKYECSKETTKPPSSHWTWISAWMVDYGTPGGVDKQGWQYAHDFPRQYNSHKGLRDFVRRRRWSRKCRAETSGPWEELAPNKLIDVSLELAPDETGEGSVALWAISSSGDVICRMGVSRKCPQGTSWHHVSTDQPFLSISIGGNYRVWATAKDGSAWYRNGVTSKVPLGSCWFHIPPPSNGVFLKQVAVGATVVYAVDDLNQLWYRRDVTTTFPEGTEWVFVCNNVRQISVTAMDEVWAVLDTVISNMGPVHGVVARRDGLTTDDLKGTGWTMGIGGGWQHICVRGCKM